jgi:hypothetical protein
MSTADDIANKLGGRAVRNGGWLVSCPVKTHGKGGGDRKPSLLIRDGRNGGLWVHCFAGCSRADILAALGAEAGDRPLDTPTKDTLPYGLRLLRESQNIKTTLAERYLREHRRLDTTIPELQECLRFHPGCWHQGRDYLPTMLSIYRDLSTNEICGVERNFLTQDGVKIERRSLGRTRVLAAIKLGTNLEAGTSGQLVVGEGLETCIAAMMDGLRPVWALGCAGGIENLPIIKEIRQLTILRENDPTGRAASDACSLRWEAAGRIVLFNPPPPGFKDHADALRAQQ